MTAAERKARRRQYDAGRYKKPKPVDRPAGDVPLRRPCMCCKNPFNSEGWHNRLCTDCKRPSRQPGY